MISDKEKAKKEQKKGTKTKFDDYDDKFLSMRLEIRDLKQDLNFKIDDHIRKVENWCFEVN